MKVLVINSGSSSIKYQLINMETYEVLTKGLLERIGIDNSILKFSVHGEKKEIKKDIKDHEEGINLIVKCIINKKDGIIKDKNEIFAIGHRVVHAGEKFNGTVIINKDVLKALKNCIPLAPLHNPANIIGIEATQKALPGIPMAGTFDTAFHQTMPEKAFFYAIPYKYYEKYRIRRYGFHGTSHHYVAKQGAAKLRKTLGELKIITCHLGNGSSMAAIRYGKSIDTTMGFTPLEGLMMGTRCGDIDPAIPMFLQTNENLSAADADRILNKESGIKGISQISSDMREIEMKSAAGDKDAIRALEMFSYRIKKYIGAYMAAMNGANLIIFTGGIGERDRGVRRLVMQDMEKLGVKFDKKANESTFGEYGLISKKASKVKVMVIPTNEELEIAEQTIQVVNKLTR